MESAPSRRFFWSSIGLTAVWIALLVFTWSPQRDVAPLIRWLTSESKSHVMSAWARTCFGHRWARDDVWMQIGQNRVSIIHYNPCTRTVMLEYRDRSDWKLPEWNVDRYTEQQIFFDGQNWQLAPWLSLEFRLVGEEQLYRNTQEQYAVEPQGRSAAERLLLFFALLLGVPVLLWLMAWAFRFAAEGSGTEHWSRPTTA